MIFKIKRTSNFDSEKKPCENSFKHDFENWHIRTCSEEEYNKNFAKCEGGLWREKGTNHQITKDGFITRQEGMKSCWAIKIDSLDELVKFSDEEGKLVVSGDSIEIYDDYRE